MFEYNAALIRVVDGDTVDFLCDLGHSVAIKERYRLYGINAPETRTRDRAEKKRGLEAKRWLIDRLTDKDIIIRTHKDKKGKFGRYLATIFIDGENVNQEMVDKGLAVEYMI